jgi:predicted MFS family arabinose efflux permease
MATAMGIGRFIYTPILPAMVEGLDLTKGEAGLIASANFLGYLAGALAAASPALPGNPRRWLIGALAVSAASTGLMGAGDSLALFLALRFAGGGASAFVLVFSSLLVLEGLSATGRSGLSALHFGGVGVGIAISAVLTWAIIGLGGDWRWMWYAGGLFSLATVMIVALLVADGTESRPGKAGDPEGAVKTRIMPLAVAYGLFGFGYVITATFIVAIVRGSRDIAVLEPFVWLAVGLAAIPSVAVWTFVGRRFGIIRAFAAACVVEAVGVVASVLWISVPGVVVAAAFLGGTFMGITALGLMAARALSGEHPRRALAVMTAAFGLGQVIGPVVAGYGFDLTGNFVGPSLLAAGALCVSAVLAASMDKRRG